jgi:hypothetical protein
VYRDIAILCGRHECSGVSKSEARDYAVRALSMLSSSEMEPGDGNELIELIEQLPKEP